MPRRYAKDQSPVDAEFCLRITSAMLSKLDDTDPDEAGRFRAGLAELVKEETDEDLDYHGASDSAGTGWQAAARGSATNLRTDPATDRPGSAELALQASRIRPAATGFLRRFPAARRIRLLG